MIPLIGELLTSGDALEMTAACLLLIGGVLFALCGTALGFVDLKEHRLPNRILYPWGALALGVLVVSALLIGDVVGIFRAVAASAAWGAAFLAVRLVHPPAIGMGDVKLVLVLGLYTGFLGWHAVLAALILSYMLGGLVSLGMVAARRADRHTRIPFGPFLLVGTACALMIS